MTVSIDEFKILPLPILAFQGIGDMNLAYQCFQLALAESNDHAESYNNLGVIEFRRNRNEMVYFDCLPFITPVVVLICFVS